MIKHKKTSAEADTAAANLIQPSNWNEDHVHAVNSIVLLGMAVFGLNGSTIEYDLTYSSPWLGTVSRLAAGSYSLPVDVSAAAAALAGTGKTLELFGHLSVNNRQALPSWTKFATMQDGNALLFDVMNNSYVGINPPVECDVYITVYGRVVAV